jgi:hypothetical protein
MGCRLTPETRAQNAFDDLVITIHQSLAAEAGCDEVEIEDTSVGRCRLTPG